MIIQAFQDFITLHTKESWELLYNWEIHVAAWHKSHRAGLSEDGSDGPESPIWLNARKQILKVLEQISGNPSTAAKIDRIVSDSLQRHPTEFMELWPFEALKIVQSRATSLSFAWTAGDPSGSLTCKSAASRLNCLDSTGIESRPPGGQITLADDDMSLKILAYFFRWLYET